MTKLNLLLLVIVNNQPFDSVGTFRSEDEDDYEYEFFVLNFGFKTIDIWMNLVPSTIP